MFVSVCMSRAVKTWNDFTPKYCKEPSQYQKVLETASHTTFMYYKVVSSDAPRSCFPHCICTTKWLVVRRQLPEAASAYYIGTTKWPVLRPELPHNCTTKKLLPVLRHLPKVSVQEGRTRFLHREVVDRVDASTKPSNWNTLA